MKKLKLSDLKVQSFVTSLSNDQLNTLKGGDNTDTNNPACNSIGIACRTVAHDCQQHSTCGSAQICSTCACPIDL
jgi:hypothetical protein